MNITVYISAVFCYIIIFIYALGAIISDLIIKSVSLILCILACILITITWPFCKKLPKLNKFNKLYNLGGVWVGTSNYPCFNYILTKYCD